MSVYQSAPALEQAAITAKDFNFWYGDFHALTGLDLNIAKNAITSFIGPSGCGKSTISALLMGRNKGYTGSMTVGGAYAALWSAQQVLEHYGEEAAK